MNGLRVEFPWIHPKEARKFLRRLWMGTGFAPIPPGDRSFADPEEACDFALSQAAPLAKWTQRLRHPRSIRLVVYVDKYQQMPYTGRSGRGEARTSPDRGDTSDQEASRG